MPPQVRAELNESVNAVHGKHGVLGTSTYTACGMLGRVIDTPRLPLGTPIDDPSREQLYDVERLLEELAAAVEPEGAPSLSPWRDPALTFYTPAALDVLKAKLGSPAPLLERTLSLARECAARGARDRRTERGAG